MMFSDLARKYLEEHAITPEQAESLGLYETDGWLNIPVEEINDEGLPVTVFTKSRNLNYNPDDPESKKYKNEQGSHAVLFNYPAVSDSKYIFICEGEMDCLRLSIEGIPAVTSTGGAGVFLPEWAPLLADRKVYICYDSDDPGRSGARKVLEMLPNGRVMFLPQKDICDYFKAGGTRDSFLLLARQAQTKSEWELSNLPKEYGLVSARELTTREFPEQSYIIDKIIYSEGFCFLFGAEGVGKSLLALSAVKAIATGEKWLGQFEVKRQVPILILDKENPLSMSSRRARALGLTGDNVFWLEYPEKFQLSDGKGGASPFAKALSTIVREKNIGLIVVDSFVDLMVGNESSSGDTQNFFDAMRTLYPNIAYLILHHENKPAQGISRTDSQRLRGSTNISAQTFTAFRLEQLSHTDLTLRQTKARDAMKLDKFMLRMDIEEVGENTAVTGFTYLGELADAGEDKSESAENAITELLADEPFHALSRRRLLELTGASGIPQRTLDRVLKKMETEKIISKVQDGKSLKIVLTGHRPIVSDNPAEIFDGKL